MADKRVRILLADDDIGRVHRGAQRQQPDRTILIGMVGGGPQVDAERLLDAEFLNIVIMLVIVTCVVGPILTERFGKEITGVGTESGEEMPTVTVAE